MLREKTKSLLSKAGGERILMMRTRENRSKIKDHTCWSWRWPQQASCQHLLPWIKRNWVWEEIWRKIQTRGGTKSCMGFQKSTLEGNSWWWRRDRQHSWGQYRGTFGPSKSSGWKALNHHQEKWFLHKQQVPGACQGHPRLQQSRSSQREYLEPELNWIEFILLFLRILLKQNTALLSTFCPYVRMS